MIFKKITPDDAGPPDEPIDASSITAENIDARAARCLCENYQKLHEKIEIEKAAKTIMQAAKQGHVHCDFESEFFSPKLVKHFQDRGFKIAKNMTNDCLNISWWRPASD